MSPSPRLSVSAIRELYRNQGERHSWARKLLGRPLTYAEKVLFAHMRSDGIQSASNLARKQSAIKLWPDRIALQDATAQMALLQFIQSGRKRVAAPSTIHCDHLIQAETGAKKDLLRAVGENEEVYNFLSSAGKKYGLGFWRPGSGIIHQVVLENYACPGTMMLGTDSHTPNAGGLGMIAIGVGGADAVDVMVGGPFGVKMPGLIGVNLKGKLNGWTAPKDVILHLLGILTVKGGTGHIVEFFGPGCDSLSCTGKATICNMGAEHGATTSIFPFDEKMATYLDATDRSEITALAREHATELRNDPEVDAEPSKFYDRVIEIDLDQLEPHVNGPHSPDRAWPISKLATAIKQEGWPDEIHYTLIGSCTNSSYEDMTRAANIVTQAGDLGLKLNSPLMITPGSDQIHNTLSRDGQLAAFERQGATILANACGPCIGQWKRNDIDQGQVNTIVNSFNRNFRGRNDGNRDTLSFIASPELVAAFAFAGRLSFNPITDSLIGPKGPVFLPVPELAANEGLPAKGFEGGLDGFDDPVGEGEAADKVELAIDPKSDRLQTLEPFSAWNGKDLDKVPVLLKAVGKCTTDHISAAGKWLKFRGHLDNISDNMFIGATNAFSDKIGCGLNVLSGDTDQSLPAIARSYKSQKTGWAVFGDENYGEGSSREHAAMSPRFLGCKIVVARSFARIHETNLKKQGVIAGTFADPSDYEKVQAKDRVSTSGLSSFAPGQTLTLVLTHEDGSEDKIVVNHSFTSEQIEWFKAGSALNAFAKNS